MTDPERLSKSSAHSLAALLLQAGAREKPSAAVLRRTTEAAAAHVVATSAASAAATVGTSGATGATVGVAAVAKWIALGALGGAVAMSSLQAVEPAPQRAAATANAVTNAAVSKPSQRAPLAVPSVSEPAVSAEPKALERATAAEAPRPRRAEPTLAETTKLEVSERTPSALLAAEVRFVDQGRAALQRGAFANAIEQLAPYESRFPRQQLLTEVLFLRMESFNRLGNIESARTLAARVLELGVVGRQAAQAREVLGR